MKYKITKNTVQETLVIPLYGRKLCSERYPALYRDETAIRLIDQIDYDFTALEKKSGSLMQRFGILEAAMRQSDLTFEVRDYLKDHPNAAAVNLGCGLDDTGRQCDNGTCRLYNLDLPDVTAVRDQLLPAGEREENIPCDLSDTAWFQRIDASGAAVLAHLADQQAVGLHGHHLLLRKAAGRVRTGAAGAAAAGARSHGQHGFAAVPAVQRPRQPAEPLLVEGLRRHDGLVIEIVGHGAHRLHQHAVAVVLHPPGHLLQRGAGRRTAPVFPVAAAAVGAAHLPHLRPEHQLRRMERRRLLKARGTGHCQQLRHSVTSESSISSTKRS